MVGDFVCFCDGGMYFWLIFGFEGVGFFYVDENGMMYWFEGIDCWYWLFYIVCVIDLDCVWIDVDIFLYDGGCVIDWVKVIWFGDLVVLIGLGGKML